MDLGEGKQVRAKPHANLKSHSAFLTCLIMHWSTSSSVEELQMERSSPISRDIEKTPSSDILSMAYMHVSVLRAHWTRSEPRRSRIASKYA